MENDIFWWIAFAGCVIFMVGHFLRKPGTRGVSFNPRNWKAIWKTQEEYRKPGYALAIAGLVIIWVGIIPWLITSIL